MQVSNIIAGGVDAGTNRDHLFVVEPGLHVKSRGEPRVCLEQPHPGNRVLASATYVSVKPCQ